MSHARHETHIITPADSARAGGLSLPFFKTEFLAITPHNATVAPLSHLYLSLSISIPTAISTHGPDQIIPTPSPQIQPASTAQTRETKMRKYEHARGLQHQERHHTSLLSAHAIITPGMRVADKENNAIKRTEKMQADGLTNDAHRGQNENKYKPQRLYFPSFMHAGIRCN